MFLIFFLTNWTFLGILRLHRNNFYGIVPESVCDNLTLLTSFYADCAPGDLDSAEIECKCCTDCCSPGVKGECNKRDNTRVDLSNVTPTLKNLIEVNFHNITRSKSMSSALSKALDWLASKDKYALNAVKDLLDILPTSQDQTFKDRLYARHSHDISMRFLLSLIYYEMSGDQWINCSEPTKTDESLECIYLDRDSEIVSGKSRWLSSLTHCSWAGITCDAEKKSILRIELSTYFHQI